MTHYAFLPHTLSNALRVPSLQVHWLCEEWCYLMLISVRVTYSGSSEAAIRHIYYSVMRRLGFRSPASTPPHLPATLL